MSRILTFCFFLLATVALSHSDPWKDIYSEKAWKERDSWQKTSELISRLQIGPGSTVADIGCHHGYMTFKLARVVTNTGRVFAVDVEQNKIDKVEAYAKGNNVSNVITIKGDYDDPKLPEGSLDAVIILDTYHEMDDHDEILGHVKASLKPGGRLLICDPIAEARRNSSRSEQEGRHELAMKFAVEDLRRAGFIIHEQTDRFIDRERIKGDKMWVVVAAKPAM
jgi:ubiquinone/menaquinone biosynthesis C-methylase UbiE